MQRWRGGTIIRVSRIGPCLLCKLAVFTAIPLCAQITAPPQAMTSRLPDAPGWSLPVAPPPLPPCPVQYAPAPGLFSTHPTPGQASSKANLAPSTGPCIQVNPYQRFLNNTSAIPLTVREKGYLAVHNFLQPGNLVTIVGIAAFTIGTNSHTAYGPGWAGFGRNTGYSFSQDATGEFFGTFLIPSLAHEDPHYHREPKSSVPHRIFHAISRTAIAQHDDGRMMPNYATLLTYPISAEISNLYVPGVHVNAASTAKRVATGLATDPVNNIITEFLPDIAKHLNTVVAGNVAGGGAVAGP